MTANAPTAAATTAPATADAVIIGGGIVGSATAYYLSRGNQRVVLVERGTVAKEQSSRAWGFVRQQGRHPAEIPLAKAALRLWGELSRELAADVEFVRQGILTTAETDADMAKLDDGLRRARDHGLDTQLISAKEIAKLVPELRAPWRAALYTRDDGHAEPASATHAFADAARRLGARVLSETNVIGLDIANRAVVGVHTARGTIKTKTVLCCSGISGAFFAGSVDVDLPVRIARSSVGETNAAPVFTRIGVWGPNVAYRPTQRGTFYIGNGYRGIGADYDVTLASFRHLRHFLPAYREHWRRLKLNINREFFADLARRWHGRDPTDLPEPTVNHAKVAHNEGQLYAVLPKISGLGLRRSWAGRMDMTPDMIPAIGPVNAVSGFLLACGFSGHGFALGPIVGRMLSDIVRDGQTELDIRPFDPHRFDRSSVGPSKERL